MLRVVSVSSSGKIPPGRIVSDASGRQPSQPEDASLDQFRAWLGPELVGRNGRTAEVAVAFGIPGIEIGRMAELRSSGLIVLGRRQRGPHHPLLLGDTADAVVRRSGRPVLAVPETVTNLSPVLAALDGTDRCGQVLRMAREFATFVGATLSAVTVEPVIASEDPSRVDVPRARSMRVSQLLASTAPVGAAPVPLAIRRGLTVEEILEAVKAVGAAVLVVGYRRGGPAKEVSLTQTARNLLYSAPCAVLTVPL
jgi:nucleotide-binding universal stress UspA family protein